MASKPRTLDEVMSVDFIKELHRRFYEDLPKELRKVELEETGEVEWVVGGQFRTRGVKVGRHIPPDADSLDSLMTQLCSEYKGPRHQGDKRLIAIAAAHHRFLWIHPFLDGNGRVVRLWTDAAFRAAGLESIGVWCLSRGLAIYSDKYKSNLAQADAVRQGQTDGRGPLTELGLSLFCHFMLETAVDQVKYVSDLLELQSMKSKIENYVASRSDLKPAARWVLYQAFIQGSISRADALGLTAEREERTARRLLKKLREEELLIDADPKDSRSPLLWAVPEHAESRYFPKLSPQ
jgi:Fic family protein